MSENVGDRFDNGQENVELDADKNDDNELYWMEIQIGNVADC